MIYRVASTAMCLTLLGAGAQVFAATSDSYTGYTMNGSYAAKITCKINGFDNPFGKDSCEASTKSSPAGIRVGVGVTLLNANEDEINSIDLTTDMSEISVRVRAYDNKTAKQGISAHNAIDDNYGNFLYFLGCTFN